MVYTDIYIYMKQHNAGANSSWRFQFDCDN